MKCPKCDAEVSWQADRCPRCRHDVGAPNVRLIDIPEEHEALNMRFETAVAESTQRQAQDVLSKFLEVIEKTSCTVVNVSADFLWNFLHTKRTFYVGYQVLVESGVRKAATYDDDRRRLAVDAVLHGSLASHITCGALSLNNMGLRSYGVAALTISDALVAGNATLLERNSFDFVSEHRLLPNDPLPLGYRCIWSERGRLSATKLARRLDRNTDVKRFSRLILEDGGTRDRDEFIEVHIYGPFDWQAVKNVAIQESGKLDDEERQLLSNARDLAVAAGIGWSDE